MIICIRKVFFVIIFLIYLLRVSVPFAFLKNLQFALRYIKNCIRMRYQHFGAVIVRNGEL